MKKILLKAMAKINLGLDVVRKREDGYHGGADDYADDPHV